MIPDAFAYEKADSIDHAISLLEESGGEAKLMAGGHSLLPMMKIRLTSMEKLIDISGLQDLKGVHTENGRLYVGALLTHKEVSTDPVIQEHLPVLSEAAAVIGDLQVRNRGTIGGNLAHADPGSDLPAVASAFDAQFHVITPDGEETLPAEAFFFGPLITALPENSVMTSISFAIPPEGARSTYLKFAHPATGYAVIGVAAAVRQSSSGSLDYVRIGINGPADVPYRARSAEEVLQSGSLSEENIKAAARQVAADEEMGEDMFASPEYREQLCYVYTSRALNRLR